MTGGLFVHLKLWHQSHIHPFESSFLLHYHDVVLPVILQLCMPLPYLYSCPTYKINFNLNFFCFNSYTCSELCVHLYYSAMLSIILLYLTRLKAHYLVSI